MSMTTSVPPSSAAAPPFVGPTPPDRVSMTLEDHLSAVLTILRTRQLSGDEMMSLRAFEEAKQQIIQELLGQQQMHEPGSAASMNGATEEYGSGFGDPIPGMEE